MWITETLDDKVRAGWNQIRKVVVTTGRARARDREKEGEEDAE